MAGLFFSGILLSFLGAILPAWRHHIDANYLLIGNYFLFQNLGLLVAPIAATRLLRARGVAFSMSLACGLACAALLALAALSPPAPAWGRMAALALLGFSAGLLNTSVFHAISDVYHLEPAATLNLGGALYGLGCLMTAMFVSGTFFVYTVPSVLILMAVAPLFAAIAYGRTSMPNDPMVIQPTWREVAKDFKSPAAILFALLLFFQFGNEGAMAGWLALFLTQRLGASPETSLHLLALYWFALLTGRVGAQWLLPRVSHTKLLLGAVLAPMFGCFVLLVTNNMFGAIVGVLLVGGGFSVILPLLGEKIGLRFHYFHPGFFNGIFSLSLTGALLAPASLGYLAHFWGVGAVMGLPFFGSIMVFLLLLLNMLESKLSGDRSG